VALNCVYLAISSGFVWFIAINQRKSIAPLMTTQQLITQLAMLAMIAVLFSVAYEHSLGLL
jgi:hypothetical protein